MATQKRPYEKLGINIQAALNELREAEHNLFPKEQGGKILPPDQGEQNAIEQAAHREFDALSEADQAKTTFESIRRKHTFVMSKVEKHNEELRAALKEAKDALESRVLLFRSTLQADLTNAFADSALDRLDRYAHEGDLKGVASLMVAIAPNLQSAGTLTDSKPRDPIVNRPARGFNPASDY